MNRSTVEQSIQTFSKLLADLERYYRINDNVVVAMVPVTTRNSTPGINMAVEVYESRFEHDERRLDNEHRDYDLVEIGSLPAATIAQIVPFIRLAEQWNANEIDELVASTTTNPRWEQRRVYRFLR